MEQRFDVIVIGAGHAGCEAALAAARMGVSVCLTTLNNDRVGYMSCNPAIGGLAKGQLVKEIDALGGEMGVNTDRSGIMFKRLNASKGYLNVPENIRAAHCWLEPHPDFLAAGN